MIFDFTVKYLGALKKLPLLPHLYDGMLAFHTFFFNHKVLNYLDRLEEEVCKWKAVEADWHKYGGRQFNIGQHELGHFHSNGMCDILLTAPLKKAVLEMGLAKEHHVLKSSSWVSILIRDKETYENALKVMKLAYERLNVH